MAKQKKKNNTKESQPNKFLHLAEAQKAIKAVISSAEVSKLDDYHMRTLMLLMQVAKDNKWENIATNTAETHTTKAEIIEQFFDFITEFQSDTALEFYNSMHPNIKKYINPNGCLRNLCCHTSLENLQAWFKNGYIDTKTEDGLKAILYELKTGPRTVDEYLRLDESKDKRDQINANREYIVSQMPEEKSPGMWSFFKHYVIRPAITLASAFAASIGVFALLESNNQITEGKASTNLGIISAATIIAGYASHITTGTVWQDRVQEGITQKSFEKVR